MNDIYRTWPYIATPIGVISLSYVFYLIIHNSYQPNYNEYLGKTLGWLLLPTYMIHQFEEHGIDFTGEKYAFQKFFCKFLGYTDIDKCPGVLRVAHILNHLILFRQIGCFFGRCLFSLFEHAFDIENW